MSKVGTSVPGDHPVAWVWGLPLNLREANAFSALEAGVASPGSQEVMRAWVVKMTLVHGSWIGDQMAGFQIWDVSPT